MTAPTPDWASDEHAIERVFVDTNVLFPFSIMDLMLALSESEVHEMVWTEELLAEWARVIVREKQRTERSAASIVTAIRSHFPDSEVLKPDYAHLVSYMPGDDRRHMAAAVAGDAQAIVTWNQPIFLLSG